MATKDSLQWTVSIDIDPMKNDIIAPQHIVLIITPNRKHISPKNKSFRTKANTCQVLFSALLCVNRQDTTREWKRNNKMRKKKHINTKIDYFHHNCLCVSQNTHYTKSVVRCFFFFIVIIVESNLP